MRIRRAAVVQGRCQLAVRTHLEGVLVRNLACSVLVMALPCASGKRPLKRHGQRKDGCKHKMHKLFKHGAILP